MEWVWTIGGWTLITVAAVTVAWALFADRARGRRRCPKCWYDMAGIPGLQCPECGRTARREQALSRCRRRWRWALAPLPVLAVGMAMRVWPAYSQQGWAAFVPSTILVLVAPADFDPPGQRFMPGNSAIGAPPTTISEDLSNALMQRMRDGKTWRWQSAIFIKRWMSEHQIALEESVVAPERWIEDKPVVFMLNPSWSWEPSAWALDSERPARNWSANINTCPGAKAGGRAQFTLVLGLNDHELYRREIPLRTVFVTDPDLVLTPVRDAATDAIVADALRPRLFIDGDEVHVVVSDHKDDPAWRKLSIGVGFEVTLLIDGKVAAVGTGGTNWAYPVWKSWIDVPLRWEPGAMALVRADPRKASFLVRGHADAPIASYLEDPFHKPSSYWAGQFEAASRVVDAIEAD
jgi:hypothetical protein